MGWSCFPGSGGLLLVLIEALPLSTTSQLMKSSKSSTFMCFARSLDIDEMYVHFLGFEHHVTKFSVSKKRPPILAMNIPSTKLSPD